MSNVDVEPARVVVLHDRREIERTTMRYWKISSPVAPNSHHKKRKIKIPRQPQPPSFLAP
jgi:hypothetical protein